MVSCTHRVSLLSDSKMLALNWVKRHVPRFTPGVYRAYINLEYAAIDVGGYRRIFLYTFCLINICLSLSDDANKIKTLNIERA